MAMAAVGVRLPVVLILCAGALSAQAAETPPALSLPLDCGGEIPCLVQHYVDQRNGSEFQDFRCGPLTYDGHKGSDFRLTDLKQMQKGVDVRAAAAGVVLRLRNEVPDHGIEYFRPESVKGFECGNGVLLDHGDDWTTQYCHMRRGSITVRPGQRLNAGEKLGLIGLSGESTFPHVHFALRHGKAVVDPFSGAEVGDNDRCARTGPGLWTAAARKALPYRASGVIRAGFAAEAPTLSNVRRGQYHERVLPATSSKLIFWVQIFGLQAGDTEEFVVDGPTRNRLIAYRRKPAPKPKIVWFSYAGKPLKGRKTWPPGLYRGSYRLRRTVGGKATTVFQTESLVTLN